MLKIALLVIGLALSAECSFPNLLNGVLLSAPPGFFGISSSWGHCDSTTEGYLGLAESNKACAERLLKAYGYTDAAVDLLMTIANSERGTHPTMTGQQIRGISDDHKKRMCKVANDCKCSIKIDWCPRN